MRRKIRHSGRRRLLEVALTTEGYDVCVAHEASAGSRAVDTFRPDLVILDVELGEGEDGISHGPRMVHTVRGVGYVVRP